MSDHTIAALCQRSRDISLEKGWLNPDGTDPRPFHTVIALFHSELSEAFEDIRNNKGLNDVWYEVKSYSMTGGKCGVEMRREMLANGASVADFKPCGFGSELADFVIRVCQYYGSGGLGNRLEQVMSELTQAKLGKVSADDPEPLITDLHASVSMAWLHSQKTIDYLAAAVLMTFDFCKKKDINLWATIDEKEAYNRTRSHRHGNKKV